MALYRGAGGAGDATGDSASEALLVRELAAEVALDAAAAEAARAVAVAAKVAAELAETNAETAEANAETAETNAETAATAAASSASAAATSATNAANSASSASTSATNAANSATAAAGSASAASTSATNAASSASSASASASTATTQATNAANSASDAATSATNASNSASAAATSASNAATSATSASNSASTATTQATNAANSATAAATSATNSANSATASASSATDSAASATLANDWATKTSAPVAGGEYSAKYHAQQSATSAINASNSASSAATSATNASNSATASASSASDAAASAAAAAASYDNFDDRYLGSKSSAPTLDNDGNALLTGALYYNNGTVTPADKGMYVYDGSQWIAASAASTAILTVYKFTATGGQTTFSGTGDTGVSLVYTAGSVIITLNGVVLEIPSEVTASSGTSVVLSTGAVAGDELNIYAFATFNVANTYTQAQVDAGFVATTGNQTVSGVKTFSSLGVFAKGSTNGITIGDVTTNSNSVLRLQGTSAGKNFQIANNLNVGGLEFTPSTTDGGTTYSIPAMALTSSGNLGIGTSSPNEKLEVVGSAGGGTSNSPSGTVILRRNGGPNAGDYGPAITFAQYFWTGSTTLIGTGQISGVKTEGNGNFGGGLAFFSCPSGSGSFSERMRLDAAGNLLVGTASVGGVGGISVRPAIGGAGTYGRIDINQNQAADGMSFLLNGTQVGRILINTTSTSYVTSSDYRLKEEVAPMTGALDKVAQLKPVTYKWKIDGSDGQGFIAHELQEVVPDCVTGEKDAVDADGNPQYQGIDTSFLVATLTAAIQEQQAIISDLRTELDSLKSEVTALKGQE